MNIAIGIGYCRTHHKIGIVKASLKILGIGIGVKKVVLLMSGWQQVHTAWIKCHSVVTKISLECRPHHNLLLCTPYISDGTHHQAHPSINKLATFLNEKKNTFEDTHM